MLLNVINFKIYISTYFFQQEYVVRKICRSPFDTIEKRDTATSTIYTLLIGSQPNGFQQDFGESHNMEVLKQNG